MDKMKIHYCARAGWFYSRDPHTCDILKSLEYTFSSFRKLLRFGRCLDSLYSAVGIMRYPDLMVRLTMTLSKVTNALFLMADHIIWLTRAGVVRADLDKWISISHRYWVITTLINLIRDIYELLLILEKKDSIRRDKVTKHSKAMAIQRFQCKLSNIASHKNIVVDAVKNGCDIFIPLSALGYTKFSPGTIGILGAVSSIIGLYSLVYPTFKLPAS